MAHGVGWREGEGLSRVGQSWPVTGQGGLLRNLLAAGAATGLDYLTVVCLVLLGATVPAVATAAGCLLGALCSFLLNRQWAFGSKGPPLGQISRYALVSAASTLLNAGGVSLLLRLPAIDYRQAWVLVRLAVFLAWSYPLYRIFVFARSRG